MDTRTMAAVDVLRHCSRAADSLQGSVREVDGSLARYHAAQRAPQPSVLRLQQYQQQQGARAAVPSIRKTTQSTALPAAKSKSAPSTTAAAAAQVESATTRTNKKGAEGSGKGPVPGNITERSASQHSDITQSSASSVNNVNPKSAGSSGKSSVKSRQPSKAYTAAMRELEDITQEAGASATGGRLSALQQGALRTLSAPVPAVGPAAATPTAAIRAVTRPPAPAMHVSTIAAAARNNGVSQQGNDVHDSAVPLINALSPTSTLSRSVNSPTRGFQSTQQQPASSAFAPYPVGQQQHEQHQQQHEMGIRDYDIDEDALLALLSEEVQPSLNRSTRGEAAASSPAQAQKKVSDNDHNSTGKVRAGSESSTSNNPGARPRKLERPASAAAVRKVVTPASTEIPKPAPSLMDSGYKTMAQIKAENERSDHQINKRIGLSVKATSMPNVKTPTASHAKLSSSRTHGHDDGVAAAADEAVYMDEGMDDSLALALQLSLEDSQQRQQQQQQLHSASKQLPASKVRTNGRAKKVTVVAPQPDRVAPPSTLLPSSRRPIPVLLPPTRHIPSHRVSSQDSVIGGSVATGVAAGSVTARRERESAAAHNRLAQERLQQQQQELRRLQEQLDAETAAALMREEQEQEEADFAAAHEYQHNMNRAEETALLRQHLHGGAGDEFGGPPLRRGGGGGVKPAGALPGWLHRTVDDFTNDALFDLAAQRSLQHDLGQHQQAFYQPQSVLPQRHLAGGRPQRPYIDQPRADAAIAAAVSRGPLHGTYNMGDANYMNVEYDEDDEILARAIQNSLNEEAY